MFPKTDYFTKHGIGRLHYIFLYFLDRKSNPVTVSLYFMVYIPTEIIWIERKFNLSNSMTYVYINNQLIKSSGNKQSHDKIEIYITRIIIHQQVNVEKYKYEHKYNMRKLPCILL